MTIKKTLLQLFSITFFTFLFVTSNAQQVEFPVLEPYKSVKMEIYPEWKPSKRFLDQNPDFLINGTYQLTEEIFPRKVYNLLKGYKNTRPSNVFSEKLVEINSKSFPATFTPYYRKNKIITPIHFLFSLGNEFGTETPMSKTKTRLKDEIDIDIYDLSAEVNPLNTSFKSACQSIIDEKNIKKYEISDFGRSSYGASFLTPADLVFEFKCLGSLSTTKSILGKYLIPMLPPVVGFVLPSHIYFYYFHKNKQADYPSLCLYQLNVKDVEGKLIKSYRQAIFIGERHTYQLNGRHDEHEKILLQHTMKVAMQSLVNQYLKDDKTYELSKQIATQWLEYQFENPNILEVIKATAKLNYFQRLKDGYYAKIQETAEQLRNLGVSMNKAIDQYNRDKANNYNYSNQNQYSSAVNASMDAMVYTSANAAAQAKAAKLTQDARKYEQRFIQLQEKERLYIEEVSQILAEDPAFNDAVNTGNSKQYRVKEIFNQMKSSNEVIRDFSNRCNSEMQNTSRMLSQQNAAQQGDINLSRFANTGTNPQLNALSSNVGNSSSNTGGKKTQNTLCTDSENRACVARANNEVKNSPEYKKAFDLISGSDDQRALQHVRLGQATLKYCDKCLTEADREFIQKSIKMYQDKAEYFRNMR